MRQRLTHSGITLAISYGAARHRHRARRTNKQYKQTFFKLPEVLMSGRRSHPRFMVATPWDGAMRVLRDVVIQHTDRDELQAVSHVPAVAGEDMTLDLMGAGTTLGLKVRVIDSRPVMVEGAVRHRIRLTVLNGFKAVADDIESAVPVPARAAEAI
jgi:hypothetical protein